MQMSPAANGKPQTNLGNFPVVAIPQNSNIIVIDLQHCFFTNLCTLERVSVLPLVYLHLSSRDLSNGINEKPCPKAIKTSPTLYQNFLGVALSQVCKKYSGVYLIHSIDDTLISNADRAYL